MLNALILGTYFTTLVMFYVVTVISPNFNVKSIIFPQFWPGIFPKIDRKRPVLCCTYLPMYIESLTFRQCKVKTQRICLAVPRPAQGLGAWLQMTGALPVALCYCDDRFESQQGDFL